MALTDIFLTPLKRISPMKNRKYTKKKKKLHENFRTFNLKKKFNLFPWLNIATYLFEVYSRQQNCSSTRGNSYRITSYLMQFYGIIICQVMIFRHYTVCKIHDDDENAYQTSEKVMMKSFITSARIILLQSAYTKSVNDIH